MTHLATRYECAGCNASFNEKLSDIFLYTCPNCLTENRCTNGISVKRDNATKLPEDLSPLKIGLTCHWESEEYEIIGRARFIYEEGYYRNQWLLLNGKEQYKWLFESYATYAIADYLGIEIEHTLFKNEEPGNLITLSNSTTFCLDSISEIAFLMREGFTPLLLDKTEGVLSIDLSTSNYDLAIIDLVPNKKAEVYYGKIVELEELKFNEFRQLNG